MVNPKASRPAFPSRLLPSRVSVWLGRASAYRLGLTNPRSRSVKPAPEPSRQTSRRAGRRPASGLSEVGSRGLSSTAGGEAPKECLTSATPRATEGRGGSRLPPTPPPPPLPPRLPAPSLVQPRPPSRAAPRGAESSRADQWPVPRCRFKRSAGPRPGAAVVRPALRSSPLFPPWFLSAPVSNLASGAPLACPHAACRPGPRRRPLSPADPFPRH